jgi:O-6-methylguanine DNA methyltransferase
MFSPRGLHSLEFPNGSAPPPGEAGRRALQLATQLDAYFDGRLATFTIPLDLEGTPFQLRVWEELMGIPYGRTCSYLDVAMAVGGRRHVRAVGAANGANPVPILVPCHRVLGSDGGLVGFGGGLAWKRRLLDLERLQLPLALD